jgi:hypothetical protein
VAAGRNGADAAARPAATARSAPTGHPAPSTEDRSPSP